MQTELMKFINMDFVLQEGSPNDMYYVFNHVDIRITYHSGEDEEWGSSFQGNGGRIIGKLSFLYPIEFLDLLRKIVERISELSWHN